VVSYPHFRDEPMGFGRRDAKRSRRLRPGDAVRLRARPAYPTVVLLLGIVWAALFVRAAVDGSLATVSPFDLLWSAAMMGSLLVAGAWTLFVPVVVLRDSRLRVRWAVPWPVVHDVDAADVDWRVGRQRIGPRLRAVDVHGRVVRIPVWILRRSDAERLFDWLDDVVPAREPVASRAPPEARR